MKGKKMKKLLKGILLAFLLLTTIIACDSKKENNKNIKLCESWDFENGFFTILSPNLTSNYSIYNYLPNFYETLVKYENGEIKPLLAEKWEISKDGKEYIFTIRKGIKFSNGEILDSKAVKKSLENVPKLLGEYNGAYGLTSTLIENIEILGSYKIKITFSKSYYGILYDLTMINVFGIMAPAAYNADGTLNEDTKIKTFGTGPYMYNNDKEGDNYHFIRNPNYWGEKPEVESFDIKIIPDNDAKLLALQSGEIDMILGSNNISYDVLKRFIDSDKLKGKLSDKKDVTRFMGLNVSKEPFNNKTVRLAISKAINRKDISNNIFNGFEVEAKNILSENLPYCNVKIGGYDYNLDEANKLLDEAGWKINSNGIREKNGIELKGELLFLAGISDEETLAIKICDDLMKIGIKLIPKNLERNSLYQTISKGEFNAALQTTYGLPYDPFLFISNLNKKNIGDNLVAQGMINVEGSENLVLDVNMMIDDTEIQMQYKKILTNLNNEAALIPITFKKQSILYNKEKIKGYDFYSIPSLYNIRNLIVETD
ncbi:nickel ABC transporter substrate-binding protein [Fusobacterium vincentii]|nr:nickel ABC transporter substrate-binding protein [Fusobacterium vincentii]